MLLAKYCSKFLFLSKAAAYSTGVPALDGRWLVYAVTKRSSYSFFELASEGAETLLPTVGVDGFALTLTFVSCDSSVLLLTSRGSVFFIIASLICLLSCLL